MKNAHVDIPFDTSDLQKSIDKTNKESNDYHNYWDNVFPNISAPIFKNIRPFGTDLDIAVSDKLATLGYVLYNVVSKGEDGKSSNCGPTYMTYLCFEYDITPGHNRLEQEDIDYICETASNILGFNVISYGADIDIDNISFYITYDFNNRR